MSTEIKEDINNMDNSDYSLKWNNFTSNLTCGFISHLTENELVDVTLAVQGKLLKAHKLVLSICSPYFKEIFKVNPCTHPVVVLKGMRYSQIEALLQFMYKGEVNISHNELSSFLNVAEELKIKGLAGDQSRSNDLRNYKTEEISQCFERVEANIEDEATCSGRDTNANKDDKVNVDVNKSSDCDNPGKRNRELNTKSCFLTSKKIRASPPPLKEIESVNFNQTKSEPEDNFEIEDEPYFLDDHHLEEYLNSQRDEKGDFGTEDTGGEFNDDKTSNSLTSAACSYVGESGAQGLLSFLRSSRGNLQLVHDGHIYGVHCRAGIKTYWKCIYRSLPLGRCRARCYTKNGSIVLSQPIPPLHDSHLDIIRTLSINGKIIYSKEY